MSPTEDPFVVVELHGRLGNQLFQFASGLGVARRLDARLTFFDGRVAGEDLLLPRLIGDHYRLATHHELLRVGHFESDMFGHRLLRSATLKGARWIRRARGRRPPTFYAWDDTGSFQSDVFDIDLPAYLQGHLQSERYFADNRAEVDDAITWPEGTPSLPPGLRPAVALSFRRGDYNSLGWALPLSYYDAALRVIQAHHPDATLLLFGDDTAFLALMEERLARSARVVDATRLGSGPITQLRLLSECDHCVMANSSFSWWGAWLGDRRHAGADRIVVAPEEYGHANDRLPERWITLESGIAVP